MHTVYDLITWYRHYHVYPGIIAWLPLAVAVPVAGYGKQQLLSIRPKHSLLLSEHVVRSDCNSTINYLLPLSD